MPYVPKESRRELEHRNPAFVGELTYKLTQVVIQYLASDPRYQDYAEALGALEATKLEIYRRAVAPYEDMKADENGDLPWPGLTVGAERNR